MVFIGISAPNVLARDPLKGRASWYDDGDGLYAAAGPDLRSWLGRGWRGQTVRVTSNGRSVLVRLTDWCQCYKNQRRERVVDLSPAAFRRLASLSRGIIRVTITGNFRTVRLPPTDVAPTPRSRLWSVPS